MHLFNCLSTPGSCSEIDLYSHLILSNSMEIFSLLVNSGRETTVFLNPAVLPRLRKSIGKFALNTN